MAPKDEERASQVQVDVEPAVVYRRRRRFPLVQDLQVQLIKDARNKEVEKTQYRWAAM